MEAKPVEEPHLYFHNLSLSLFFTIFSFKREDEVRCTHNMSPFRVLRRSQRLPSPRHVQDVGVQFGRHHEFTAKGEGEEKE